MTNLLNKNDLGLNEIVKQTALAARTRARNVPLNKFRWNKNYLLGFVDCHLVHYPTPIGLTYAWSFGSLAGMCLVIQILSGTLLSTHYTANIDVAFSSVEYIMRDVPSEIKELNNKLWIFMFFLHCLIAFSVDIYIIFF